MLFSVIVPVYNKEQYLRDCVDSILAQTFSDYELILVDDGSTDESGDLCDQIAEREEKVTSLHQTNSGPAAARLTGVVHARGEYVLYVDGDDWIENDTLETAAEVIRQYRPDMVCFAYVFEENRGVRTVPEPVPEGYYCGSEMREIILPAALMNAALKNMHYGAGRVTKRPLLLECQNQVRFSLSLGEDAAMSVRAYAAAENVYVSEKGAYHYRILEQSASHGLNRKKMEQVKALAEYFEATDLLGIPDFEQQVDRYISMLLFSMLVMAAEEGGPEKPEELWTFLKKDAFRQHLRRAYFRGITPKTAVVFRLMRSGRYRTAYLFLKFCAGIKGRNI